MVNELEVGNKYVYARLAAMAGLADGLVYSYPAPAEASPVYYTFLYQSSRATMGNGGDVVAWSPLYLVTYHAPERHHSLQRCVEQASRIDRHVTTTGDSATPGAVAITDSEGASYSVVCVRERGRSAFLDRDVVDGVIYNRAGGFYRLIIVES